jgi:hypothetical protein
MKNLIIGFTLLFTTNLFAGQANVIYEISNLLESYLEVHESMSKQEIVEHLEGTVEDFSSRIKRRKRAVFLKDAQELLNTIKNFNTANDILVYENDIITELRQYRSHGLLSTTQENLDEAPAILFLPITLGADLLLSPFRLLGKAKLSKETRWARKQVKYLLKHHKHING